MVIWLIAKFSLRAPLRKADLNMVYEGKVSVYFYLPMYSHLPWGLEQSRCSV